MTGRGHRGGSPRATPREVVSKILYLRQHYHFGPARIAAYLSRHGLSVAQSSVHRILGKHGVNRLPANQKHRPHAKRWKRYEKAQPGHRLQLDVKFLERIPGTQKRIYQFTAIDDCTRLRILKVYDACNQRTAVRFIDEVLRRLPFRVLAFAGQCGSERSMGFALIGNAVNLAARLMQSGKRQVLCDAATRAAARRRVVFEALPPLSVKGRNQAVAVFTPLAERQRAGSRRSIGRRREWKVLSEELALLESGGSGNVVLLEGEPGIGKSRLVADLLQQTQASSVRSLKGAGDSIEKSTAYYPWKEVLGRVLHLETLTDTAARQGQIREIFGDKSDHERYMSLLNSVFSVSRCLAVRLQAPRLCWCSRTHTGSTRPPGC